MRILLLALLAGCSHGGLPFAQAPHLQTMTVHVNWLTAAEIKLRCGPNSNACATVGTQNGGETYIWAQRPISFGDEQKICSLGHELLHSLGARH